MENKVIRCPRCGSVHLEPRYNKKKHTWRAVYERGHSDSLLQSAYEWAMAKAGIETRMARDRNAPSAFWICQVCGEEFPML